jgi:hypothetical protein
VGQNVARLFKNLPNISAEEGVHQEKLGREGKPQSSQDQEFRYLCMTPIVRWGPSIEEYRSDSRGNEVRPAGLAQGFMLTAGFVSAPILFHPAYQNGSDFRLLGRQKVNGRDTYVLAFAQVPARSRISGVFRNGKESRSTHKQGLAWIDTESHQIVRLVSDLLKPLPQVKLEKVTTEILFNEVRFQQVAKSFWLPLQVSVTLDWNGRVLRNQHVYSDFMVFDVDSTQRLGEIREADKRKSQSEPAWRGSSPSPPEGGKNL